MTQPTADTQEMLDSLRTAVAETLERKRRLGQYVVIWEEGKPVLIGDDVPVQKADDQDNQGRELY
ncbi:hypothetical protein [Kushneria sp. EE4]